MKNVLNHARALLQKATGDVLFDLSALTMRPLWSEDDLFCLLEDDLRDALHLTDLVELPALRREAERLARADKPRVTLADIYVQMGELCGGDVTAVAAREQALRMRLILRRDAVAALAEEARSAGRRLLYRTDEPLTEEEVRTLIRQMRLPEPDALLFGEVPAGCGVAVLSSQRTLRAGWKSVLIPSPVACMEKSGFVRRVYGEMSSAVSANEALRYLGIRTLLALLACRCFSDPEAPWKRGTIFGGRRELIGDALGMSFISQALWLADEAAREGYTSVGFLARDGYWLRKAFDAVTQAMAMPVRSAYVRISRKAVFPLHFRSEADFLSLPLLTDVAAHSAETLLALFLPVVEPARFDGLNERLRAAGIEPDAPLKTMAQQRAVMKFFVTALYEPARFAKYREYARSYLAPLFPGKSAVVDVGYKLRSEAVIREVTGAEVTAYFVHADSDMPDRRASCAKIRYRTLLGASPYVSWVAREQFLLEDAPGCVGYDASGAVMAKEREMETSASREIAGLQARAMDFACQMTELFGSDLSLLHFRPADGCAPFECYLHSAPAGDTEFLRGSKVENGFLTGSMAQDSTYTQWLLMQADFRAARRGAGACRTKLRRAWLWLGWSRERCCSA